MNPKTRRGLMENMDSGQKDLFANLNPEAQEWYLDHLLYVARSDAAERALAEWEGRAPIPPEIMAFVEHAVEWTAAREYPIAWVGEWRMTPEELLELQQSNDENPEWMRLEPGETVRADDDESAGGITIPGVGVNYLDGLTALEQFDDHLSEQGLAELEVEVMHMRAAKQGMVVVTTDSWEQYEKRLAPIRRAVPINELQPEDVDKRLLDDLDFYAEGTVEPYVMHDSEEARRAVDARVDSRES